MVYGDDGVWGIVMCVVMEYSDDAWCMVMMMVVYGDGHGVW